MPSRNRSRGAGCSPRRAASAGLVLLLLPLAGCASYVATSSAVRPLVEEQDYAAALRQLDRLDTDTSRLLYLYERALVLNEQDQFAASNAVLDSAETLFENLYTRSVSREAAALLVSEGAREYRGEKFESALVHYYRIMNSLNLGDLESAAVQARRLAERLAVLAEQGKAVYAADPFLEYLTGIVFQAAGELDEAGVSYRRALAAYADHPHPGDDFPPRLYCDLADVTARLGEAAEAAALRAEGECPSPAPGDAPGAIYLFLECGYVSYRGVEEILLPIFKDELHADMDSEAYVATLVDRCGRPVPEHVEVEYVLRVSLPKLVETPSGITGAHLTAVAADGAACGSRTTAVVGADVAARAERAFAAARPGIFVRAVARGLAKYLAKRKAEKEGGPWAGYVVNAAGVITETADTRCWSLLPEKILVGRLDLPAGEYTLRVELCGSPGRPADAYTIPGVRVERGRTTCVESRVH